jgi:hypothetical protein
MMVVISWKKILMWVSVGKTRRKKNIPQITINRWFKPFPNGRFIVVLPPLIYIWD